MKAIKAQLSHGLKVEKELLNTRAALQELRTIRDQQANVSIEFLAKWLGYSPLLGATLY